LTRRQNAKKLCATFSAGQYHRSARTPLVKNGGGHGYTTAKVVVDTTAQADHSFPPNQVLLEKWFGGVTGGGRLYQDFSSEEMCRIAEPKD
jgi:hypothetical protein